MFGLDCGADVLDFRPGRGHPNELLAFTLNRASAPPPGRGRAGGLPGLR